MVCDADTSSSPGGSPASGDPRQRVRDAASRLAEAQTLVDALELELARALHVAHLQNHAWADLADDAGMGSAESARQRAMRGRAPVELPPSAVGVTQAAEHFGVSRQAIYERIKQGRLKTVQNAAGRTRVLLDDESSPPGEE